MVLKMDAAIKAKWIDSLRSGDYKQGKGALRRLEDSYCCLGVLCEVAVKEGAIPAATLSTDGDCYDYDEASAMLPMSVIKWAGMRYEGEERPPSPEDLDDFEGSGRYADEGTNSLVYANDSRSLTFDEIADLIETEFVAEAKK